MKKLLPFFMLLFFSSICFAGSDDSNNVPHRSLSEYFPKDNSIETIHTFIEENFAGETYTDDLFSYLFKNKKESYVIPFYTVLKTYYPDKELRLGYAGIWTTPLCAALQAGNEQIVEALISLDPALINKKNMSIYDVCFPDPIVYAVRKNNLKAVQLMLPYIADVNNIYCYEGRADAGGSALDGAMNILTCSTSLEMDALFIKAGVEQLWPGTFDSYIVCDSADCYAEPSVQSVILATLKKSEPVKVTGCTYKVYRFNRLSYYGQRWVRIRLNDTDGWLLTGQIYIWEQ